MPTTTEISVNGVKITAEQINSEVQYHPAKSLQSAQHEATQALVIRELLLQRAVEIKLCEQAAAAVKTDEILGDLLAQEMQVIEADEDACRGFYASSKQQFFTAPLFEASHILYPASADDNEARNLAATKAQKALDRIQKSPELFSTIAAAESACSSAKTGGHLGQIATGQTTPAFEAALLEMQAGDISPQPIASEFGYHLLMVHKRSEGKQLPFEAVKEWITDHLSRQSWQQSFSQYVQFLAGQAEISGFQLRSS